MVLVIEVSTTNYEDDELEIKKAMSHLQTQCGVINGYQFSEPISRFGWTFFPLWLKPSLITKIEEKFEQICSPGSEAILDD